MARPQKNNCDYFSHDNEMRNHRKIKSIRNKFGITGYAVWCMFLEYLTGADGNVFENSPIEFELLAGDFCISVTEINDILNYALKIELLFQKDGFIFSESLNKRLEPVYLKRGKSKEISEKQKRVLGKFATNNSVPTEVSVTETPQSKVNESKVNESKLNLFVETSSTENKNDGDDEKTIALPLTKIKVKKDPSSYSLCIDMYNNFIIKEVGIPAKIDGQEGKAMKAIIKYLETVSFDKSDKGISDSFNFILGAKSKWDLFHQNQLKLSQINSNIINILKSIKDGKSTNSNSRQPTPSKYSPLYKGC